MIRPIRPRRDAEAGDRLTYCEDNVRVRVEVLKVEDAEGMRTFSLKALEESAPHAIAGRPIQLGQEFDVSASLDQIDKFFVGWYFQ